MLAFQENERLLFLSPHFDDIAFSTWSLLSQDNMDKTVLTLCGGGDWVYEKLSSWDRRCGFITEKEATESRREEDIEVCEFVHADAIHLGFADFPYTGCKKIRDIEEKILANITESDVVLLPAGVGQHKDHLALRDAALNLCRDKNKRVFMYADLPYASVTLDSISDEAKRVDFSVDTAISQILSREEDIVLSNPIFVDVADMDKKLEVVNLYRSQIQQLEKHYQNIVQNDGGLMKETYWEVLWPKQS